MVEIRDTSTTLDKFPYKDDDLTGRFCQNIPFWESTRGMCYAKEIGIIFGYADCLFFEVHS